MRVEELGRFHPVQFATAIRVQPFQLADGFLMLDLGTLGGTFGIANWLNNRGQVVGQSNLVGDLTWHPFLWERGELKDLGTLGGDDGLAMWLNDAGEVVGEADLPGSAVQHAFLWRNGVMTDLGSLGTDSAAFSINSKGQVVALIFGSVSQCLPFGIRFYGRTVDL